MHLIEMLINGRAKTQLCKANLLELDVLHNNYEVYGQVVSQIIVSNKTGSTASVRSGFI